jgi:hypothetical protein
MIYEPCLSRLITITLLDFIRDTTPVEGHRVHAGNPRTSRSSFSGHIWAASQKELSFGIV